MYCMRSLCRFLYLYTPSESLTAGWVSCTLSVLAVLDLITSHSPAVNMTDWPHFQPGLFRGKATVNTLSDIHIYSNTYYVHACVHRSSSMPVQIHSQIDTHTHSIAKQLIISMGKVAGTDYSNTVLLAQRLYKTPGVYWGGTHWLFALVATGTQSPTWG